MDSDTRYIELKSSCGLKKIRIILRELIDKFSEFLAYPSAATVVETCVDDRAVTSTAGGHVSDRRESCSRATLHVCPIVTCAGIRPAGVLQASSNRRWRWHTGKTRPDMSAMCQRHTERKACLVAVPVPRKRLSLLQLM